jgi:O-antigen ligase
MTDDPFVLVFAVGVALYGTLLLATFAYSSPRAALALCYGLVLIAGTKFRVRDSSASLSGVVDFQILIELSLYAAVGVIVFVVYLARWRLLRPLAGAEILLFGYVLLALFSVRWSVVPSFTGVKAIQLLVMYGLALLSVRILGSEATVRTASVSVVLYVLLCTAAVVIGVPTARNEELLTDFFDFSRLSWFAVHPIAAGTYAGLATVSVLTVALSSPSGWRERRLGIPAWLYIGPLFLILVKTFSRGPLLAALAAASVLILRKLRLGNAIGLAATATIVIVTTLAASTAGPGALSNSDNPILRVLFRGQTTEQLAGLSGRVALWETAVPVFLASPVFGHGYHGSRPILIRYATWAAYAHNAFLQTLLDLGIVGALLLWPVIGWVVLTSLLRWRHKSGAIAGPQGFVLGTAVFLFINSISSESFAATPGCDILLVFVCTSLVSHVRLEAVKDLTVSQRQRLMTTVAASRQLLHVRSTQE